MARHLLHDFVLEPLARLIDHSIELTSSPGRFAQRHIELGNRKSFRRAFAFVVAAFSVGLTITQLGMFALQIDGLGEISYWLLTLVQALLFISLLTLILSITERTKLADLLHILFYPLGVAIFVASIMFTVAALTIYASYKLSFIPPFKIDPSRFPNFEQSIVNHYRICLGGQSFLYDLLRSGGMQFDLLAAPIRYLPFARLTILISYIAIFGYLVARVLRRSIAFSLAAVLLSAILTLFGLGFGIVTYDNYLYTRTTCMQEAIQSANLQSAEDQLKLGVEELKKKLTHDPAMPFHLEDVKVEERSVVFYYVVDTSRISEASILGDAEISRREAVEDYCRPDVRFYYNLNATLAHIYRARDGRHLYTYTIGRDDCRK